MTRNTLCKKMIELSEPEKDALLELAFKLFEGQETTDIEDQEFSEAAIFFKGVENAIDFGRLK